MTALTKTYKSQIRILLEGFGKNLDKKPQGNRVFFLRELFSYAGISEEQQPGIFIRWFFEVCAVIFVTFVFQKPGILALLIGIAYAEYRLLRRRSFSRAEKFEKDYTAFLLSLGSAIRTGLDPIVALVHCSDLFQDNSVVKLELKELNEKINRGVSEESAINEFAATIEHPDITLFKTAFILSRRQGSSISHCLERLVKVTRHRQSFRRKVVAAVAMQKLSSYGIAVCAIAIGVFQIATNPEAARDAIQHPLGFKALIFGISLMVIGLGWMIKTTSRKI